MAPPPCAALDQGHATDYLVPIIARPVAAWSLDDTDRAQGTAVLVPFRPLSRARLWFPILVSISHFPAAR